MCSVYNYQWLLRCVTTGLTNIHWRLLSAECFASAVLCWVLKCCNPSLWATASVKKCFVKVSGVTLPGTCMRRLHLEYSFLIGLSTCIRYGCAIVFLLSKCCVLSLRDGAEHLPYTNRGRSLSLDCWFLSYKGGSWDTGRVEMTSRGIEAQLWGVAVSWWPFRSVCHSERELRDGTSCHLTLKPDPEINTLSFSFFPAVSDLLANTHLC